MNDEDEIITKCEELANALINNENVSRWDILTFKKQIKEILIKKEASEEVFHEFYFLIDSAKESI